MTHVTGGLGLGVRNAYAEQVGGDFLINFQGALRSNAVNLGASSNVTVTHRTAGVNYYGVETLNVDLGSGADVVNVQGTAAATVTNLNTHAGEDRIYISSTAGLTTSTFTDQPARQPRRRHRHAEPRRRHRAQSPDGFDEASSAANGSLGTPALLTNNFLRGFAPAQINYTATAGNFAQGITVWTGGGADIINVTSTATRAGVLTTTTLNTGAGNDTVTVSLSAATDGFFALNTQDVDDTADASASSLPVIIFLAAPATTRSRVAPAATFSSATTAGCSTSTAPRWCRADRRRRPGRLHRRDRAQQLRALHFRISAIGGHGHDQRQLTGNDLDPRRRGGRHPPRRARATARRAR